ncbi:hypothetical protein [Streptomyces sp. NPDC127020]|uniref:hypothetical protein n=1 Tax=Streptomyces sp. NPDC127020 TaxID=3347109 RepID=UPI003652ABDE
MRTCVSAATAVLLLAALTACGGGGGSSESSPKPKAAASKEPGEPEVDCMDESIGQADWMKYCSDEGAGTGGDGTDGQSTGLKFGESYTWPDGLRVTVVSAKKFTDFNADYGETPEPGSTDFRVSLKLENRGKASVDLGDLSTITEGATNGGQAAFTQFDNGSQPLEGRLATGVTATKTNDNVLETKYGRKIVVTVQRNSEAFDLEFPEFEGEIKG